MSASKLGAVIVSYNTRELLLTAIESLQVAATEAGLTLELVLVDNASQDGSVEAVAERYPEAELQALSANIGFTAANNLALERWLDQGVDGPDFILLINPDAALEPEAVRELVSGLRNDPLAAVAGPALYYADGRFQHAAFRFPGLIQGLLERFPIARLTDSRVNGRYPRSRYDAGQAFEVDFVLGACMLVRRAAFLQVGALDPGFFMYCEEIDWCQRFRAAGWHCLCVPSARALHHAGASSGQRSAASSAHLWRSRRRYARKHLGPIRRRLVLALIRLSSSPSSERAALQA